MARGFVYILINPAIPGYIKIGKTTKAPEERAKELSAATGVPTPFIVAYDATFADCDEAETRIHTLLESRGISRTPDREFFAMNLREAIAVVIEAERNLQHDAHAPGSSTALAGVTNGNPAAEKPVWLDVLSQAENYDYGLGDTLQNQDRAVALYKQAARLGAAEAYERVAELYADRGDPDEGLRWLTHGAEGGVLECWAALASIYMNENFHFEMAPQKDNARKAWRQFFRAINPQTFDPEGSRLYAMLRLYVDIVRSYPDPTDTHAIRAFEQRFVQTLAALPTEAERQSKLGELRELTANLP